jgi:glycosyltransferase involved in cell wall biosynthesis
MATSCAIVVPTVGRPSLFRLLAGLADQDGGPVPAEIVVVDDRPAGAPNLEVRVGRLTPRTVRSVGRGPAAARNLGWRSTTTEWVAFLDDDVVPAPDWWRRLTADLAACPPQAAVNKGRIEVPLPRHRRPTDAERDTANLATAAWITADLAVRRAALEQVGGFDERFRRAYREDAELALRLRAAGWQLTRGARVTVHPVRPSDDWVSVRAQAGNADDVLMRRLHGPGWRAAAAAPRGRLRWHAATTAAAASTMLARLAGAPRGAAVAGLVWAALTAKFAWQRIAPGPRTADEIRRMIVTSVAIPPAAVAHRLLGGWRHRHVRPDPGRTA